MPKTVEIEGMEELNHKLAELWSQSKQVSKRDVIVGYEKNYALYVHENIEMKWRGKPRPKNRGRYWDPLGQGQAKFLEEPARRLQKTLGKIVATIMERKVATGKRRVGIDVALFAAGERLQRESQMIVPVDTGDLKGSAFTRFESVG